MARRAAKHKAAQRDDPQSPSQKPAGAPQSKRVKKTETVDEFIEEPRNMEDLWKCAFLVGTEWENLDALYQYKWNFSNLEDAFEEGGLLHGKQVYLFGCTESLQQVISDTEIKVLLYPVVVAVVSPVPPSDKIGIKSVQREVEDILPMKQMKMEWAPYVPLNSRDKQLERMKSNIYILRCNQRRSALKHLKIERVKQYEYSLPYFYNPFIEDEFEQSTEVSIMFPSEPPVICEFDWEFDELEEFVDNKIKDEVIAEDQKDAFKEFVKEKVREQKRANREVREARKKIIEEMSEEKKQEILNTKIYKFYPQPSPDTPDLGEMKVAYINRYYGKAHQVL